MIVEVSKKLLKTRNIRKARIRDEGETRMEI